MFCFGLASCSLSYHLMNLIWKKFIMKPPHTLHFILLLFFSTLLSPSSGFVPLPPPFSSRSPLLQNQNHFTPAPAPRACGRPASQKTTRPLTPPHFYATRSPRFAPPPPSP